MELIKVLVEALEEVNAKDIKIYKTGVNHPLFDYVLIATAVANRQMDGLISKVFEKSREFGFSVRGVEGKGGQSWLLIDVGFAILNLFTYEERLNYDLDRVFSNLPKIDPKTFVVC